MANKRKGEGRPVVVRKPSDGRAGKRKDRNKRVGARVPELGYYLIVTDTEETEKNYFEVLRDTIPAELKDRLVIRVEKAKTVELVRKALELTEQESQYRIPWIVFDRDQVKDFDEIVLTAEKNDVGAGWSNPCFEIWMYAYFGE
ncbi:MAG: RloB family protein, partial [Roseburia sp.]|nr:RloB family protein [Roseburia sp.]